MQITIETADVHNLGELLRIERECFTSGAYTKEQITSLLRNPNAIGFITRANSEAMGFIIGTIEKFGSIKIGHVYTLDVAVKHRRKGIGLRLLAELESAFLKRSVKTSYLEVRVDNEAARKLYKQHGYVEIESLEDYYSTGVHGLRLKKQLKP